MQAPGIKGVTRYFAQIIWGARGPGVWDREPRISSRITGLHRQDTVRDFSLETENNFNYPSQVIVVPIQYSNHLSIAFNDIGGGVFALYCFYIITPNRAWVTLPFQLQNKRSYLLVNTPVTSSPRYRDLLQVRFGSYKEGVRGKCLCGSSKGKEASIPWPRGLILSRCRWWKQEIPICGKHAEKSPIDAFQKNFQIEESFLIILISSQRPPYMGFLGVQALQQRNFEQGITPWCSRAAIA